MQRDIWKFTLILTCAGLFGFFAGHTLASLLVVALFIIIWQVHRLNLLYKWVVNPKKNPLPETSGQFYLLHREINRRNRQNSKRKKQLSKYLTQFRKAVSALPDAIILIDDEGFIEWANHNAAELLDIKWPNDSGIRLASLIRDPKLTKLLEMPKPDKTGIEIPSPLNSSRFINIKCIRYTDKLRMVLLRDVSRLLKINQMHKDFVANVSHELKTPLTVLKGYIEVIQNTSILDQNQALKKAIGQMAMQNDRMENIVHDLLYLSKLEDNHDNTTHGTVDITHLVNNIIESVQSLVQQKEHKIELNIDPNINLCGQVNELHSAFSNLIQNAIHYTPANGIIKIAWNKDKQGAYFSVDDNGIGIQNSHISRLTERFYRLDHDRSREKGGTGLGLAIVKHVLQRHQATLEIDSTPGQGSHFRCSFPKAKLAHQSNKNQAINQSH